MNRRDALMATLAGTAALSALLTGAVEAQTGADETPFALDLQRGADRYRLDLRTQDGFRTAAWLMRDIRSRQMGWPDPKLLQLLAWGQASMALHGYPTVLVITSGLRVAQHNSLVEGAARASFHLPDQQHIFRAVDVDPVGVHRDAWGLMLARIRYGGVGFYRSHTHIDSGPPGRTWVNRRRS